MKRKRNRKTQKAPEKSAVILSSLISIKANLDALERKAGTPEIVQQA